MAFDDAFFLSSQFARKNAIVQYWRLAVDIEDTVTVVSCNAYWCDQSDLVGVLAYVKTKNPSETTTLQPNVAGNVITAYATLKLANGSSVWELQYVTPGAEKLFPQTSTTPPVTPQVAA
jgi:hypothetical protein